jgi:hypothetical protein
MAGSSSPTSDAAAAANSHSRVGESTGMSRCSTPSPEVDAENSISEECDHALRTYYGIRAADQELWSDNKGYATLVPDEAGRRPALRTSISSRHRTRTSEPMRPSTG